MSRNLYRIALHEAGHIVIGKALGLSPGAASIIPSADGYWAGRMAFRTLSGRPKQKHINVEFALARATALYAGSAAELLFGVATVTPKGRGQIQVAGSGDDDEKLKRLLSPQLKRKLEPELQSSTVELVREHRHKIRRVARQLMKREQLSARMIELII